MLWACFKQFGGQPPREEIQVLAIRLRLHEQQIYKWFWDTLKKVKEDEETAINLGQDASLVRDENGSHTVKQWKHSKECQGYDGRHGCGTKLSPLDIKAAIKTYKAGYEKMQDYDELALLVGLRIDDDAH